MKNYQLILIGLIIVVSCKESRKQKFVWVGLNNSTYLKSVEENWSRSPPPPPPIPQDILEYNFIQIKHRGVYFYSLPIKQLNCATPWVGLEHVPEINLHLLQKLTLDKIIRIEEDDFDSILSDIIKNDKDKLISVAVGINDEITRDKFILAIVNRLIDKGSVINWKVRKLNENEMNKLIK